MTDFTLVFLCLIALFGLILVVACLELGARSHEDRNKGDWRDGY